MSTGEHQRYRFGPLERRSLIGSLRVPQVLVIAVSLTAAVILMRTLAAGAGIASALAVAFAGVVVCFWPVGGRAVEEWLPVVGRHVARRVRRRNVYGAAARQAGVRPGADGRPES